MKKIILFLMIIIFLPPAKALTTPEPPDTVKVIENASNLIVSRSGDTTTIEVTTPNEYAQDIFTYQVTVEERIDSDEESLIDFEIPFGIGKESKRSSSHKRKLQTSFFAIGNCYVGQRFNYSDKGNVKNSYEIGVRNLIGLRWSHGSNTPSFSVGFGFGAQRYSAQKGFIYGKEGSSLLLLPAGEGVKVKSTDLHVFTFQFPLLFTIPIGRDVEFVAGAVGCLNTYARALTEVEIGNYKYKTKYTGLQQRLFTAELTTSLGVCDVIGIYASWSPMTIFQSPFGPQLKSWSLGATINF